MKSTWVDPDDAPEWTDEAFARAELAVGGKVIRPASGTLTRGPGRPRLAAPKQHVSMRLDADVLEHFRATGRGWQGAINAALRKAAGL
jgi:uncharacterized protein (DUF4415 family)